MPNLSNTMDPNGKKESFTEQYKKAQANLRGYDEYYLANKDKMSKKQLSEERKFRLETQKQINKLAEKAQLEARAREEGWSAERTKSELDSVDKKYSLEESKVKKLAEIGSKIAEATIGTQIKI